LIFTVPATVPSVRQSASRVRKNAWSPSAIKPVTQGTSIAAGSLNGPVPPGVPSVRQRATVVFPTTVKKSQRPTRRSPYAQLTLPAGMLHGVARRVVPPVPSVRQSCWLVPSAARKYRASPVSARFVGSLPHGPGQKSPTRRSLPGEPSLRHSSRPEKPSSAVKYRKPPEAARL